MREARARVHEAKVNSAAMRGKRVLIFNVGHVYVDGSQYNARRMIEHGIEKRISGGTLWTGLEHELSSAASALGILTEALVFLPEG